MATASCIAEQKQKLKNQSTYFDVTPYLSAMVPLAEYQRRRLDLEQQLQSLHQTERQSEADSQQQSQVASLARSIEDFATRVRGSLEQASFEQKRQLDELLIGRVIVTNDQVEIRYLIPTTRPVNRCSFVICVQTIVIRFSTFHPHLC